MGGLLETHYAYIIPDLSDDILIGYPWLKRNKAVIDSTRCYVRRFKSEETTLSSNTKAAVESWFDMTFDTAHVCLHCHDKDMRRRADQPFSILLSTT